MHVNHQGLALIEEEEAFIPFVYDDFVEPRTATDYAREWKGGPVHGTLTIGYGTTAPRARVRQGNRIDRATAEQWLAEDLREAEDDVARLVKVPLNENQFSALVSFVYNVGAGALQRSTLLRRLNAGDYDGVPRELNKFTLSKGVRLGGLVRRRAREGALWSKPCALPDAVAAVIPTETDPDVPLATVRPDEPETTEANPPHRSKTIWGGIWTYVAGNGAFVSSIFDRLNNPYTLAAVLAVLSLTGVGLYLVIKGRLDIGAIVKHLSDDDAA